MSAWDWIGAAGAFTVSIVVAIIVRAAIRRLASRSRTVSSTILMTARIAFIVIIVAGIYVACRLLGVDLGGILAGLGIAGIAVAFALKDIAANYISGILMGFRQPFRDGDEIISGDHEGSVVGLNLRYTTIRTYDGVKVMIPNSQVLASPLTNLTVFGNRRTDFAIGVAYDTDLEAAQEVFIVAVAAVPGVDDSKPVQAWVEELAASWISIRVRYWHGSRIADVWQIRSAAITAVLKATRAHRIDVPFEHRTVDVTRAEAPPDAAVGGPSNREPREE